jgi:Xaa-Pro aminopeptidase
LVPTEHIVERVRVVKDEGEIATLREAARRLSSVARQVPGFVAVGRSERDIAADVDAALRRAGFERSAFETIVASGPNSALPHARPTGRILEAGEGVVLDFGAVYDGYCVDLTRTLQTGPCPAAFRRIFGAVVEAHAAALAAVRPGARASDIDAVARAAFDRYGLGGAFGHGTGHGLGLELHEEPRLAKAGAAHGDTVVEPGMVFTIEPGAYVPGVGGVRIEDDVLVVDGGAEVLTDVPIEL